MYPPLFRAWIFKIGSLDRHVSIKACTYIIAGNWRDKLK
jgi:hypothetical protein